jgi:hypothetical protein
MTTLLMRPLRRGHRFVNEVIRAFGQREEEQRDDAKSARAESSKTMPRAVLPYYLSPSQTSTPVLRSRKTPSS